MVCLDFAVAVPGQICLALVLAGLRSSSPAGPPRWRCPLPAAALRARSPIGLRAPAWSVDCTAEQRLRANPGQRPQRRRGRGGPWPAVVANFVVIRRASLLLAELSARETSMVTAVDAFSWFLCCAGISARCFAFDLIAGSVRRRATDGQGGIFIFAAWAWPLDGRRGLRFFCLGFARAGPVLICLAHVLSQTANRVAHGLPRWRCPSPAAAPWSRSLIGPCAPAPWASSEATVASKPGPTPATRPRSQRAVARGRCFCICHSTRVAVVSRARRARDLHGDGS